jgi:pimeloyl-ACP methyl ester carboxylesterase
MQGEEVDVPYKIIDMAKDTIGLMDALEVEKVHLCGISMGGMIAQTVAINFPERVLSLISIMSTTGNPDLPPPSPEATTALLDPPEPERDAYIEQRVAMWRIFDGGILPFDEDTIRNRVARSYDRSFSPLGTVRQLAAISASGNRKSALKSIDIPSLIIHGDADPLVPIECGRDTAEAIPGAKFVTIEGMGHNIPPNLAPQVITEISNYIKVFK